MKLNSVSYAIILNYINLFSDSFILVLVFVLHIITFLFCIINLSGKYLILNWPCYLQFHKTCQLFKHFHCIFTKPVVYIFTKFYNICKVSILIILTLFKQNRKKSTIQTCFTHGWKKFTHKSKCKIFICIFTHATYTSLCMPYIVIDVNC